MKPDEHKVEPELDAATIIVEAFKEKFGAQAIHVATLQLNAAGPDSSGEWRQIIDRLKHTPK